MAWEIENFWKNKGSQNFKVNPQNAWRKPKLVDDFNKQLKLEWYEPITQTQLIDAYSLILNLDSEKIKEYKEMVANKKNMPLLYKLILNGLGWKKSQEQIEKMLDRMYGKAIQKEEQRFTDKGWNDITIKLPE